MKKFIFTIALGFMLYLPQNVHAQTVKPMYCPSPRRLVCTAYGAFLPWNGFKPTRTCIQYQCLFPSPYGVIQQ